MVQVSGRSEDYQVRWGFCFFAPEARYIRRIITSHAFFLSLSRFSPLDDRVRGDIRGHEIRVDGWLQHTQER